MTLSVMDETLIQAGLDARIARIQTLHSCDAIKAKKTSGVSHVAIVDHVEKCLRDKGLFERG